MEVALPLTLLKHSIALSGWMMARRQFPKQLYARPSAALLLNSTDIRSL